MNAINSTSIRVQWIKPDKSVLHGDLREYVIEHKRVECNNEPDPVPVAGEEWQILKVTSTSVNVDIGQLVFWSCYEVRMRAVTVGEGPYSNVTGVRTMEHGDLLFLFFFSLLAVLCTFMEFLDISMCLPFGI